MSSAGRSHVGSLRKQQQQQQQHRERERERRTKQEEQQQRFARDVFNSFATHSGFVYGVTDTKC